MKKYMLALPLLLVAAVLVSGCALTPYDGSPPKVSQSRIDAVTASATAWLSGPVGSDRFPGGTLAAPIPIFSENSDAANYSVDHWVLPVVNSSGMYMGFFLSKTDSFASPSNDMLYPEPRHNLFSTSKEDAYLQMLNGSAYLSDQVKEPFLTVVAGKGYTWTSNVVVNGQKAGALTLSVSIIDPSPEDNKLISKSA